MQHIQVTIFTQEQVQKEIIIALLSLHHFDAFEEKENELIAIVEEQFWDKTIVDELLNPMNVKYSTETLVQTNWNQQWESSYEPIIVNTKVGIRASFHPPLLNVDKEIIITPKMSFGTGHHATTRMVMDRMSELDFSQKNVFDYGCGTGVLAIYASYLGAKKCIGIDIDEWCIENSIENAQLNQINQIDFLQGDIDSIFNQQFDIILANINLYILEKNMQLFHKLLLPNGQVLLSGFLDSDLPKLEACAKSAGFISTFYKYELNWSILHITKI